MLILFIGQHLIPHLKTNEILFRMTEPPSAACFSDIQGEKLSASHFSSNFSVSVEVINFFPAREQGKALFGIGGVRVVSKQNAQVPIMTEYTSSAYLVCSCSHPGHMPVSPARLHCFICNLQVESFT